jgi:hypothetical protein
MTRPAVDGRALPIAAIAAILVALVATHLPHLNAGPLDYDEGIYWLSLRSMRAGHPLFTAVYSSQPPAFLLMTEPPWSWLGGSIEAARAVMLAWSVIAVTAGAVLGWRLGGPVLGVAVAVLLTVDPRMVDQSITCRRTARRWRSAWSRWQRPHSRSLATAGAGAMWRLWSPARPWRWGCSPSSSTSESCPPCWRFCSPRAGGGRCSASPLPV